MFGQLCFNNLKLHKVRVHQVNEYAYMDSPFLSRVVPTNKLYRLGDTVLQSSAAHGLILRLIMYHVISYITSVSVLAAGARAFNWSNKQARQGD